MLSVASCPVIQVPLTQIVVSKANMRSIYDAEAVEELARSLGEKRGQLYPILLHRIRSDKYEIVVGSRRFKAARKAQWPSIAASVLEDISEPEMIVLSLAENLHRQDLTPFEEAKAILKLCKEHDMSPGEVARRIKKPIAFVKGRLKILSVPDPVQHLLSNKKVTINHVGILASLSKPQDQIRYAKTVAKQRLSEEDLTTLIHDEVKIREKEKPAPQARRSDLFSPLRTTLKVKRFTKFLHSKVRPQVGLDGKEAAELRNALREVRGTIDKFLTRRK